MKMYDYLVAYNFTRVGYLGPCTGSVCISRDRKISTIEDITELNKLIEKSIEGSSNVAIYNFILLGRNEH